MTWLDRAYRDHRADVYAAAMAVLRDREAAEDVVQDVFLRLGRHSSFDPARGSLAGYLRLLGRSRALDAHRSRGAAERTRERWLRAAPTSASADGLHDEVSDGLDGRVLRAAVGALPPAQREAVALTYWAGMSASAVAEHTGAPLGTVKSRVRLGLERLRAAEAAAA